MVNINLLPPEIKAKIQSSKKTANIFSICLVFTIALVVLTFLLMEYNSQVLKTRLDNEKKQLETASETLTNFNSLLSKAAFLSDRGKLAIQIDSTRPNWAQVLESMINSVPTNVAFASLNADIAKSPNFVLEGTTTDDREAIKFKDKLTASPFFKDVAFKSSQTDTRATDPNAPTPTTAGIIRFSLEFNLAQNTAKTGTK